ncbi:MAG TPA: ABC transporter ATP-binding protein [Candidatus Limiplasma sp.]|nr:ABC transporter ATP-binding protein [Candidatus Limiplasma sp.]HPR77482.1 ABC transporter ATP-binding protein [Candidatus Limiplasma sp.]
MLEVRDLTVRYGALCVADSVSFSVQPGEWLMIAGPNGAGKSTVLNAVAQAAPYTGQVLLNGRDARRIRPRERAKMLGILGQSHAVGYAFTVEEIVRLGRYAYSGPFSGGDGAEERAIDEALALTGMEPFRTHSVLTLSGGELQRAFLAQLFAQNPSLLLLDEPTNHLDLVYQKQVFELIRKWLGQPGRAAVSVVHDLSLAMKYGTHAILLNRGRVVSGGTVVEALTDGAMNAAYGMDVREWMNELYALWNLNPARMPAENGD